MKEKNKTFLSYQFEALISCMYEKDFSIVERSNLNCNCCIINQCNREHHADLVYNGFHINKFDVEDRGLSKSRNMALEKSKGEIVLLCDDDERFIPHLEKTIIKIYQKYPSADIIIFDVGLMQKGEEVLLKKGWSNSKWLNKFSVLKVASVQISFRREAVVDKGIRFDEEFGSGSKDGGAGEENIFLEDCLRNKLKIRYVPVKIATVLSEQSNWFKGYTPEYFIRRGKSTKRMLGWLSIPYAFYFVFFKYHLYSKNVSLINALSYMIKGIFK